MEQLSRRSFQTIVTLTEQLQYKLVAIALALVFNALKRQFELG